MIDEEKQETGDEREGDENEGKDGEMKVVMMMRR